jgi:hypothetical protein
MLLVGGHASTLDLATSALSSAVCDTCQKSVTSCRCRRDRGELFRQGPDVASINSVRVNVAKGRFFPDPGVKENRQIAEL